MRGGDQITSRGGVYTSNSGSLRGNTKVPDRYGNSVEKVGNRFVVPLNSPGEGDLMLLHTDFGVDLNAEPLEQIRQFKNKSIDYDVINADRIEKVTEPITSRIRLKKKSVFDTSDFESKYKVGDYMSKPERKSGYRIKMSDPNIIAIQHPYFDPSVYERVLVTTKRKAKLADIIDREHIVSTGVRSDRQSGATMDYADNLFLPYAPSNDFRTLLHYSRIREAGTNRIPNEATEAFSKISYNRAYRHEKLAERRAEFSKKLDKIVDKTKEASVLGGLVTGVEALGYGLNSYARYKEKQDWDEMSDEDFFDYYEKYANHGKYIDEYAKERKNRQVPNNELGNHITGNSFDKGGIVNRINKFKEANPQYGVRLDNMGQLHYYRTTPANHTTPESHEKKKNLTEENVNVLIDKKPVQVRVLSDGTIVDSKGTPVKNVTFPYTVDSEGNFHTDLPSIYSLRTTNKDIKDIIADVFYNTGKFVNDSVLMNENDVRTKNLQKVSMEPYFNKPTKQIIGTLDTAGDFIFPVSPAVGTAFKIPGYVQDVIELVEDPSMANAIEMGLNGLDILPFTKGGKKWLRETTRTLDIPIPNWLKSLTRRPSSSIAVDVSVPSARGVATTLPGTINSSIQAVEGESGLEKIFNEK